VDVEFGTTLPLTPGIGEYAARAEELGFGYLTSGEHVAFHVPTPMSMVSLAAAASVTTRARLVSSVALAPLYPPALLAKLAATLDVIAAGRLSLGVGIGGEHPKEFEAVGVNVRERGARTDEALEILDRLLRGGPSSYQGRFTSFEDVSLGIDPVQSPRLPFWVAGRKGAAIRRAARFADVWMPYMYTPEQVAESVGELERASRELGLGPWRGRTAVYLHTTVYPDSERARRVAVEAVGAGYNQDFAKLGRYLLAGTAEECAAKLERYVAAGASIVIFRFAGPPQDIDAMMRQAAEEIVPRLRAAAPSLDQQRLDVEYRREPAVDHGEG
jgi:alkanesulfonate monooxygenase SsuD/methylene tetrahydromethanopterin reductase-like flavin-dependent oxidoreductase (luciferase family)